MNFFRRFLARRRIRNARQRLASHPSPQSYLELAQEFAKLGSTRDVVRTCEEGLAAFLKNPELRRLRDRAKRVEREQRLVEVKAELAEAPRPALWQELCDLLLESGRVARAQETAEDWRRFAPGDAEAQLTLARILVERYYQDRGREDGRRAVEALDEATAALPGDARPLKLKLALLNRIGAWKDARRCAVQLLQLDPGNPSLEGRFRTLDAQTDESPNLDRALLDVERTGFFADEEQRTHVESKTDVRPILRSLAEEPDVQAAMYVRGQTALVQGPRGATAERLARTVREIITSGRTAGRRLGLGQIMQVDLEGDFGSLTIAPGELDAGALWSLGRSTKSRERVVLGLAGINANVSDSEVAA